MDNEYDLMKYKLANDALGIALWDMYVETEDPVSPGNKITWSQELRDMLGFSDENDFPNTIAALADRFHPDDSDMVFAAFAAHFNDRSGKTPYNVEYRLRHKNGEYRWFRGFGTTLRDSGGAPRRVAGAVMDIDARKRTQNQLMIMSGIVQHSPNFISYKKFYGECLYVNPAATLLTGYTQDELKKDYLGSLFDDETVKNISAKVLNDLGEGGISHYEARGKTKGGVKRVFEVTSFLVEDDAFATVATDVTEARKIETERIEALKALEYSKKLTDALNKAAIVFLSQRDETFEEMMSSGLKPFCDALDLDRVSVWRNLKKPDGLHVSQIYRWDRESGGTTKPTIGLEDVVYADLAPRWEGLLAGGGSVSGPVNLLPEAAMLKSFGIVSAFVMPVFISNAFWGFMLFEDRRNERYFDNSVTDVMRSAAFLCANTVIRSEMEQKMIEAEVLKQTHKDNERYKVMAHWYEALLDAIPFSVSVQDINENWTFINTAAEVLLGKRREEIEGKPCKDWGFSICGTDECAIACAKRGQMRTFFSHESTPYQVDTKLLKDLDGEAAGYIEIIQDITQIERITKQQAEAEAANSVRSSFLSVMSHEMKTPMNAIIGMTFIGKNANDLQGKDYALNNIEDATVNLLGLINDVLDMSKIGANKLELSQIAFDLRNPLQKAVHFIRTRVKDKCIEFSVDIAGNIPLFFTGDDQRLTQVITNLLSNAVKFTPKGGKISLTVSFAGEEDGVCKLRFEVADSGIGISGEQQERIFLPFEQVDSGITRKYGGTGLGLVISKRIIELMDGEIWVESELGKGALFVFTIKLRRNVLQDE